MGDMKDLIERIENEAKQTIGYAEAENKESFMTGVSVALTKAIEIYEVEIDNLRKMSERYKASYESTNNDLKTISSILNRYSDND